MSFRKMIGISLYLHIPSYPGMSTVVDSFDSVEGVIASHYCLRKMKYVIKICCGATTDKEISKIFSRFVISCKTLGNETHSVVPEFSHKESAQKFEKDLIDKFRQVDIPRMRAELSEIRDEYLQKMHSDRGKFTVVHEVDEITNVATHAIEYGAKDVKPKKGSGAGDVAPKKALIAHIPDHIFDRLLERCENKSNINKYAYCVYLRYMDVTCGSMDSSQWCCSEDIYNILINEFKCKVELFASPINCHPRMLVYGSLFHDTDRHFGSMGTYTRIISEKRLTGIMYAHPPAIELLLEDFVIRLTTELSLEDRPLGFFTILPYWSDAQYYKSLTTSAHCRRIIVASAYANSLGHEDLSDAYFTCYSPLLNKDIPLSGGDRTVIVIMANDLLWKKDDFQSKLGEHFPEPE
jgi:Phosphorylated CTD interacting factor 1 WW domain